MLYVSAPEGQVYALSRRDGALVWEYEVGGLPFETPTVVGDMLFISPAVNAPEQPYIYALDTVTGALRWRAEIPDSTTQILTVADGEIYIATHSGLHALLASDGAPLWLHTIDGHPSSPPMIVDDMICLSLWRNFRRPTHPGDVPHAALVKACRRENGAQLWERAWATIPVPPTLPSSPSLRA